MTTFRRLRGLLIALGILAFSANLAFAGQLGGKASSQAAAHQPAAAQSEGTDEASETPDTETADTESADPSESACPNIDLNTVTDLSSYTHGEIVCSAAHMDTPAGYANHGAWVSHWAKGDNGSQGQADSHRGKGEANKP